MATMKLGVTYSLFDGEELLPFSILSIRPHVDYINVVFQEHSWFGDKCTPLVRPMLAPIGTPRTPSGKCFFLMHFGESIADEFRSSAR